MGPIAALEALYACKYGSMALVASELADSPPTFLMTDVEGSTRRWELNPAAMALAMQAHDSLVIESVSKHGGRLIKQRGEGDSQFAVFGCPVEAAKCAVDLASRFQHHDWGEVSPIRLRIALNTGECGERDGDFYGPVINRCARMRAAASGGQIVISESVYRAIRSALPQSISISKLGAHRFKDLLEAEQVFQLQALDLPASFGALKSLDPSTHNLPVQLTSFVGRGAEMQEVRGRLDRARLVTLTGAGGCGKTRLSIQTAAELVDSFEDGVWFVELVGLTDGTLIPQTIADALHVTLVGDDPVSSLLDELKGLSCLLLLDNCEHLLKAAGSLVGRILRECPGVRVLATSRERLHVTGEHVFIVPPLECDLKGDEPTLERVATMDSVKLLCERAASRTQDEILSEASADAVARLCKRLDGIPLAIEQAACNLPYLSPDQILDRLEQRLSLLELDVEDVDPRHRTLRATIDWSYEMLSGDERLLFKRLSVFAGGWTLEAAESICSTQGLARKAIFELLQRLVARSLVSTEMSSSGFRRYRLLEPIREYALSIAEPDCHLRDRHFEWHLYLAKEAYEQGLDAGDGRWLRILTDEHDNVRSALTWALETKRETAEPLLCCIYLNRFWLRRGHIKEGLMWIERCFAHASTHQKDLYADATNVLGVFLWQSGRLVEAEQTLDLSLEAWIELGDRVKSAAVTNNLACLAFLRKDLERARTLFENCVEFFDETQELGKLASSLENLGVVECQLGHVDSAIDLMLRAADAMRKNNDRIGLAKCLTTALAIQLEQESALRDFDRFFEACDIAIKESNSYLKSQVTSLASRVALLENQISWAARLLGAYDALVQSCETQIPFAESEFRNAVELSLRERMPPELLRKELKIGRRSGDQTLANFKQWLEGSGAAGAVTRESLTSLTG